MSKEVDHYNVELRVHFERNGEDDYTEDDYQFDTRKEAMTFANENGGECHDVREYYKDTDGHGMPSKSIW
jgi:hypothetical protein